MKKKLSIFLILTMLISLFPASVFADEIEISKTGFANMPGAEIAMDRTGWNLHDAEIIKGADAWEVRDVNENIQNLQYLGEIKSNTLNELSQVSLLFKDKAHDSFGDKFDVRIDFYPTLETHEWVDDDKPMCMIRTSGGNFLLGSMESSTDNNAGVSVVTEIHVLDGDEEITKTTAFGLQDVDTPDCYINWVDGEWTGEYLDHLATEGTIYEYQESWEIQQDINSPVYLTEDTWLVNQGKRFGNGGTNLIQDDKGSLAYIANLPIKGRFAISTGASSLFVDTNALIMHKITATAGEGGSISPSGEVKTTHDTNRTFTITPEVGYVVKDVKVDGETVGAVDTYTFTNVIEPHAISATFEKRTYHMDTGVQNGTIDPRSTVKHGETVTIKYTPDEGFELKSLYVDEQPVDVTEFPDSYTFENITSNHNINAVFGPKVRTITTAIENGTIDPKTEVDFGNNATIHYEANEGYQVKEILVDGEPVDINEFPLEYTFEEVTEDHAIKVICELTPDLHVEKEANAYDVNVGDEITYTVKVSQEVEGAEARNIVITDTLAGGLTLVPGSIDGDVTIEEESEGGFKVTIESLTDELTFTYKAIVSEEGIKDNNIIFSAENYPGGGNAKAMISAHTPKASITKEVNKAEAEEGEIVTFTITAKQEVEGATLRNAVITDKVSEDFEILDVLIKGDQGKYEVEDNVLTVAIPDLKGETVVTVNARVLAKSGELTNTASLVGDGMEEEAESACKVKVLTPDITVTKVVDKAEADLGDTVKYTINVNVDKAKAKNIIVSDLIPDGVAVKENTIKVTSSDEMENETIEFKDGFLTVKADSLKGTMVITFDAEVTTSGTDVRNMAAAVADNYIGDPAGSNYAVFTAKAAELSLTKTADKETVKVGDTITYTLKASSKGKAINVVIMDTIPEGVTLDKDSIKAPSGFNGTVSIKEGLLTIAVPELDGDMTITYTAKAAKEGNTTNIAEISADNASGQVKGEATVKVEKAETKTVSNNPKTGDGSNMNIYAVIGVIAAVVLIGLCVYKGARKGDKKEPEVEPKVEETVEEVAAEVVEEATEE